MCGGKISQDHRRLRIPAWHVKTGKELQVRSARERRIWARLAPIIGLGVWQSSRNPVVQSSQQRRAGAMEAVIGCLSRNEGFLAFRLIHNLWEIRPSLKVAATA